MFLRQASRRKYGTDVSDQFHLVSASQIVLNENVSPSHSNALDTMLKSTYSRECRLEAGS
jgi:hypothetical protein